MTAAPRCPFCNAQGVNHIASKVMGSFALIFCGQCGAVYGVVPKPQQPEKTPPTQVVVRPVSQAPPPAKKQKKPDDTHSLGNLSVSPALKLAGEANLSEVIPYSQVATRMKLSAMNHGTLYNQVAEPDGPPICPTHKFDLIKIVIPQPYKNAGYKVWLCPHGGCDQWRLAETPK